MMATKDNPRGTLIAVAGIILAGGIAGLLLGRGEEAPSIPAAQVAPARVPAPGHATFAVSTAPAPVDVPAAVIALGEAELAKLAEASMTGPRDGRLAAIAKLSKAPREQALPLLERVLLNGEPGVDRPAALQGLRELALAQGDADQRIRDAVREVIYHGDDEALAADAQETLDVIGESEMSARRGRTDP